MDGREQRSDRHRRGLSTVSLRRTYQIPGDSGMMTSDSCMQRFLEIDFIKSMTYWMLDLMNGKMFKANSVSVQ